MAAINGMVGRLTGTLAYHSNRVGGFNCQIEVNGANQLQWTYDQVASKEALVQIDREATPNWGLLCSVMTHVPTLSTFTWGVLPWVETSEQIIDAVYHLSLLITVDDGSIFPVSITCENGVVTRHTAASFGSSSPTNAADVLTWIRNMWQAITGVTVNNIS